MAPMSISLTRLPPELRVQIFAEILRYNGVLQRRSTVATEWLKKGEATGSSFAPGHVTLHLVDPTLFLLCRTFSDEALDVFYDLNSFRIHYNHLCTCQGRFRFAAFDAARVRRLEIYEFYPRQNVEAVCKICQDSGIGLLDYLNTLPRLRKVVVAFEDFSSIAEFVQCSSKVSHIDLQASEVGKLHAKINSQLTIELRLPLLNQAWRNLALTAASTSVLIDGQGKLPGEESVRHALEYLQYEANDWGRLPTSLCKFLVTDKSEDPPLFRLRLIGLPDSGQRLLNFTVALAEVLSDLFLDDCTGDSSMEWEYIGCPETLRWDFRQGIAM